MIRTTVVLGLSALLLSLLTGCSGLSQPNEIQVAGEIMANPSMPMPAGAANRPAGARQLGKSGPRPTGKRRSGG